MKSIFTLKFISLSYVLALFLLVVLPINGKESAINSTYLFQLRLDYFFHILFFLPWMPLLLFSKNNSKIIFFLFRPLLWLFLGFVLVFITEGIQYFIPYRAFNNKDLFSNTLGLVLGLGLFLLFRTKFQMPIKRVRQRE
jgi:glycopeptide antibiotics resistance protein